MDSSQPVVSATSPWKHALAFDSTLSRPQRAWDRVAKTSTKHKGRKVWKRQGKVNDASGNADKENLKGVAIVNDGAKRQRLKQVPAIPKQSKLSRQSVTTLPGRTEQLPRTPERKKPKRQSLRTGLLKRAMTVSKLGTSPTKKLFPSSTSRRLSSPLKRTRQSSAGANSSLPLSPRLKTDRAFNFQGKSIAGEAESSQNDSEPLNSLDSNLKVPQSTRYSLEGSIQVQDDVEEYDARAAQIKSSLDPVTKFGSMDIWSGENVPVLDDLFKVSEERAESPAKKGNSRAISDPQRAKRRMSKRQSDIGPKGTGKMVTSTQKRRSFGSGQSFKFDMSSLPTLDELKAVGETLNLQSLAGNKPNLQSDPELVHASQDFSNDQDFSLNVEASIQGHPNNSAALVASHNDEIVDAMDLEVASPSKDALDSPRAMILLPSDHARNQVETRSSQRQMEVANEDMEKDPTFTKAVEHENTEGGRHQENDFHEPQAVVETIAPVPRPIQPVSILRNSLSPRKRSLSRNDFSDDDDLCVNFAHEELTAVDDISEDELGMSPEPGTPLMDDDATVPVMSPAYRANTAGSPPPEATALANLEDNFLDDEQMTLEFTTDFTGDVTADIISDIKHVDEDDTVTEESQQSLEMAPKRTRSGARFSDDTSILKEFLNRAHARKAAQALQAPPPSKLVEVSPRRSPRKALGTLDNNSPSPAITRSSKRVTPSSKTSKSLPIDDADDILSLDPAAEVTPAMTRRSGRSKLPGPASNKSQNNAAFTLATSFIPVRRADGQEPVVLQRSWAQELASTTRNNTRRNKGAARMPKLMLETTLNEASNSPIKQRSPSKRSGKGVNWDDKLVYYQEDVDSGKKRKTNSKKVRSTSRAVVGTSSSAAPSANAAASGPSTTTAANNHIVSSKKSAGSTPRIKRARSTQTINSGQVEVGLDVSLLSLSSTSGTPAQKRRGRSKV